MQEGSQVGDYKITKLLGEGGMGMVYKGEHTLLGHQVAIKVLHPALTKDPKIQKRFIREAQALARLQHPNMVQLHDFKNTDEGCFIIMEFVSGKTIEDLIHAKGLIPPEEAVDWFVQALSAMQYAHEKGIIHRDIKPSNIMVLETGTVKVLDFGTAKIIGSEPLTRQGMTLGTVVYMSPEQLLGRELDFRSDLYSLGVTLYEMTTGKLPFYDESEFELVKKIARSQPDPPSTHYKFMPKPLEDVIMKSIAKDPNQRYQSATEFMNALLGVKKQLGGAAAGAAPVPAIPSPAPVTPAPIGPGATAGQAGQQTAKALPPVMPTGLAPSAPAGTKPNMVMVIAGGALLAVGIAGGVPCIALDLLIPGLALLAVGVVAGGALLALGFLKGEPVEAAMPVGQAPPLMPMVSHKPPAPTMARQTPPLPPPPPPPPQPQPVGSVASQMTAPQAVPGFAGGPVGESTMRQMYTPPPEGGVPMAAPGAVQPMPAPPAVGGGVRGFLYVMDGQDAGKSIPLSEAAVTIGRGQDNVLCLNDMGVSTHHAQIAVVGGQIVFSDTNSRNGSYVNNQRVMQQILSNNDVLVLGSTRMVVTIAG